MFLHKDELIVLHCVCSALSSLCILLFSLFLAFIAVVICGQLMAAHWAGVVLLQPWCQTRRMEDMPIIAWHDLDLIAYQQVLPACTQEA